MKIMNLPYKKITIFLSVFFAIFLYFFIVTSVQAGRGGGADADAAPTGILIDKGENGLGFEIPTFSNLLTFAIRGFFVIAGLAALFYMLLGAFAWVTSGGDKDAVSAAQQKIQAAVIGVLVIVAVLAIAWTLEQVVFRKQICFGLSCPLELPALLKKT